MHLLRDIVQKLNGLDGSSPKRASKRQQAISITQTSLAIASLQLDVTDQTIDDSGPCSAKRLNPRENAPPRFLDGIHNRAVSQNQGVATGPMQGPPPAGYFGHYPMLTIWRGTQLCTHYPQQLPAVSQLESPDSARSRHNRGLDQAPTNETEEEQLARRLVGAMQAGKDIGKLSVKDIILWKKYGWLELFDARYGTKQNVVRVFERHSNGDLSDEESNQTTDSQDTQAAIDLESSHNKQHDDLSLNQYLTGVLHRLGVDLRLDETFPSQYLTRAVSDSGSLSLSNPDPSLSKSACGSNSNYQS
ncbi:hypothetical protein C8J56DRAFT_1051448 [Mycena floridula]|nr:hypothetical protein C8J56DRAFT_1051448 [Mycena floridula]